MRNNKIRTLWAEKKTALCGWMATDSTLLAETIGVSGVDAVTVDLQHGAADLHNLMPLMQAISATPAVPLVRLPGNVPEVIMKALDFGAYGVICPLINSSDEAAAFVRATRYPPQGDRSFATARVFNYAGADYFYHANDEIIKLAMIETKEGLENLDEIVNVEGLDGIFIGPTDLAIALGLRPGPEGAHPELEEAIAKILAATKAAGKYCSIFCSGGAGAKRRRDEGFDLVVPTAELYIFKKALAGEIEDYHS
ncbi:MAG: HpcH/HpaI aldolase family protein [Candidatus Puniceispirillaceae bacterium]